MAALAERLRSGDWLTRERVRLVAVALLAASLLGLAFLVVTSDGLNDRSGRPLGTDFSNVYAAGTYVLEGQPAAPFEPAKQFAREQAIFGTATQFYGWHYPPFFLALAALLALLPYAAALFVWQGATFALYISAMRAITGPDRLALLLALAFPAVFINLGHGHNGFLTAALMAGALLQLDKRPVARRHPVRAARLQAAVRIADPVCAGRERTLAHIRRSSSNGRCACSRRHPRLRHRRVARLPRLHELHPRGRARTRRHRLAQDPERFLLGAHVGRIGRHRLSRPGAL